MASGLARDDGWTPSTGLHRRRERERLRDDTVSTRRRNTARGRLTKKKKNAGASGASSSPSRPLIKKR